MTTDIQMATQRSDMTEWYSKKDIDSQCHQSRRSTRTTEWMAEDDQCGKVHRIKSGLQATTSQSYRGER
eukprot:4049892-Amphidinium_carterae.1